ncbi:MAG UNVERIFIED_CONTAM: hypothetical protein LVR18_03600 [Planctomycetaceae bacterium]|jgi:phosphoglycerate-specific signal transduction histidine kinase
MKDMFLNFPQNISNLGNNPNYSPNLVDMRNYLSSENGYIDTMMKYLHVGRYVMFATIGNSDALAGFSQQNDIKISYQILPPGLQLQLIIPKVF